MDIRPKQPPTVLPGDPRGEGLQPGGEGLDAPQADGESLRARAVGQRAAGPRRPKQGAHGGGGDRQEALHLGLAEGQRAEQPCLLREEGDGQPPRVAEVERVHNCFSF